VALPREQYTKRTQINVTKAVAMPAEIDQLNDKRQRKRQKKNSGDRV
jgi:hypothetical protein